MKGRYGLINSFSDWIVIIIGLVFLCLVTAILLFGFAAVDQRMEEASLEEVV